MFNWKIRQMVPGAGSCSVITGLLETNLTEVPSVTLLVDVRVHVCSLRWWFSQTLLTIFSCRQPWADHTKLLTHFPASSCNENAYTQMQSLCLILSFPCHFKSFICFFFFSLTSCHRFSRYKFYKSIVKLNYIFSSSRNFQRIECLTVLFVIKS